jgi:hypothetical protein
MMAAGSAGCSGAGNSQTSETEALTAGVTYQVGPGKPFATLQEIASSLVAGDVVQVYGRLIFLKEKGPIKKR